MHSTHFSSYNKKIGIWGFGTVGKSALNYFAERGNRCTILDKRELSLEEQSLLAKHQATYLSEDKLDYFFSHHDLVFASPGIDINLYKNRAHFICELDVFTSTWHKPIIAVTGTVGKTSTTTLLGNLLQERMRVAVGGNIGTPMLTFLEQKNAFDCAVLELSSWQLEHAQSFTPDIAVWTNFFPNHLDRHKTLNAYFHAKLRILLHQTATQTAIIPFSMYDQLAPLKLPSRKIWIHNEKTTCMPELPAHEQMLFIRKNNIIIKNRTSELVLGSLDTRAHFTYVQNTLCAAAVLHVLNLPFELLTHTTISVEHRLEKLPSKNAITFYNDSKATVPESTLAAVAQCKDKSVILFLGGLSKGIDRSLLIRDLPRNIKEVICFGKEAEHLQALCVAQKFNCTAFNVLEPAVEHALQIAAENDIVLFSPAGSSYDLYTDYAERGKHFKQLIAEYPKD
jgi:UDP-N-acetylmuramoylalanine--D-glutamate ligase